MALTPLLCYSWKRKTCVRATNVLCLVIVKHDLLMNNVVVVVVVVVVAAVVTFPIQG
jgi:hypothetical protein